MVERRKKPPRTAEVTQRARTLRRQSTGPERALWYALRDRRLAGLKFRRQVPVDCYVVDFMCEAHGVVIEVDGQSFIGRAEYDEARTRYLCSQGYRVLRIDNDDAVRDLETALSAILQACGKLS